MRSPGRLDVTNTLCVGAWNVTDDTCEPALRSETGRKSTLGYLSAAWPKLTLSTGCVLVLSYSDKTTERVDTYRSSSSVGMYELVNLSSLKTGFAKR